MKIGYILLDTVEYSDLAAYGAMLPPARQAKIARYRHDSDKLLSLVAGLMIRRVTDGAPLTVNEHGKPYAAGGVYFSVSHSGRCVAIAADDSEIGVDVERLPDKDHMRIARRCYHPNELSFVKHADDTRRAFTRVWTRKEAYLKQLGIGIATDLRAFDTLSGELNDRIVSFDLDGYVISVCAVLPIVAKDIYISELELKDLLPQIESIKKG